MRPFIHRIDGGDFLRKFPASTKMDPNWSMLLELFEYGRAATKQWMEAHYNSLGVESTLDLRMAYTETPRHDQPAELPEKRGSSVAENVTD